MYASDIVLDGTGEAVDIVSLQLLLLIFAALAATPRAATPCAAAPRAVTPRAAAPRAATPRAATPRAATPRAAAVVVPVVSVSTVLDCNVVSTASLQLQGGHFCDGGMLLLRTY